MAQTQENPQSPERYHETYSQRDIDRKALQQRRIKELKREQEDKREDAGFLPQRQPQANDSPEAKLLYPIAGNHVKMPKDKTPAQPEAQAQTPIQVLERIAEAAETGERKNPSQMTAEELFHAMYRIDYLYSCLQDRSGNLTRKLSKGKISADKAEKYSYRLTEIQHALDETAPQIYDEIAKRLGLTFEQKERVINRVYSKQSGIPI